MTGWPETPWPREHHEEAIELLRAGNGGGLPMWAASADLVYLAWCTDRRRGARFPGEHSLAKRWGVPNSRARKALRDPEWQEVCERHGIPIPDRRVAGPPEVSADEELPPPSTDALEASLGLDPWCSGCESRRVPGGGFCPRCAADEERVP